MNAAELVNALWNLVHELEPLPYGEDDRPPYEIEAYDLVHKAAMLLRYKGEAPPDIQDPFMADQPEQMPPPPAEIVCQHPLVDDGECQVCGLRLAPRRE